MGNMFTSVQMINDLHLHAKSINKLEIKHKTQIIYFNFFMVACDGEVIKECSNFLFQDKWAHG